jgi:arabinan endo-1,5-alpha-L-arabinosidase
VIGPGHNSFIVSPSGREEFVVYHAWHFAHTSRQMRIDRVHWVSDLINDTEGHSAVDRPVIEGPTWTPQPSPV